MRPVVGTILAMVILTSVAMANAMLTARLLELELRLSQRQLMNYAFASEALRARFGRLTEHVEEIASELDVAGLESTVMNQRQGQFRAPGPYASVGLVVINGIRFATGKAPLSVSRSRENLFRLQTAFALERKQRHPRAREVYRALLLELDEGAEERAFALLHDGYCAAILGKNEAARQRLNAVIANHDGTLFAEDARILLQIMSYNEQQELRIARTSEDPAERLRRLFEAGRYTTVRTELGSRQALSEGESYMYAVSLERTGNHQSAGETYRSLARSAVDRSLARRATRRLLMLGHAYGGDESLREQADTLARGLGMAADARAIRARAMEQVPLELSETATEREQQASLTPPTPPEQNRREAPANTNARMTANPAPPTRALEKAQSSPGPAPAPVLELRLADGRVYRAAAINFHAHELALEGEGYRFRVPDSLARSVRIGEASVARLQVILKDGDVISGGSARWNHGKLLLATPDGELEIQTDELSRISPAP